MKGFKGFKYDPDTKELFCKPPNATPFVFKQKKTHKTTQELEVCRSGFHFCTTLRKVLNYYPLQENIFYTPVEAVGDFMLGNDKVCTDKIQIGEILTSTEVMKLLKADKSKNGFTGATSKTNTGFGVYKTLFDTPKLYRKYLKALSTPNCTFKLSGDFYRIRKYDRHFSMGTMNYKIAVVTEIKIKK